MRWMELGMGDMSGEWKIWAKVGRYGWGWGV